MVLITLKTTDMYETAAEAATILGIVITPLAGIAAAAFGIKLSADAKSATKEVALKAQHNADKVSLLRDTL